MTAPHPEPWQSGPVEGVPALLQPVAHALLNCQEQIHDALDGITSEQLAARPQNVASLEFHLRHACGSLDRLFTYARGESLSDAQREYLSAEKTASRNPPAVGELLALVDEHVERAIDQLRTTDDSALVTPREVGRAKLPSTVMGLLFHGAEHTARHTGQIVTTAKLVRALSAAS
jgi:uncharacterized damage-inducible protein DinB